MYGGTPTFSVWTCVCVCLFNAFFSPLLLSDPHRHSQDDSWVFGAAAKGDRGKVDRADRTVATGRSKVPSAETLHAHGRADFGWLGSSCRTASVRPPFWRICLPVTFAHLRGRHSEMASPWSNKHTPHSVRLADMLVCVNIFWTTSATHFRAAPFSRLPSIKDMIH